MRLNHVAPCTHGRLLRRSAKGKVVEAVQEERGMGKSEAARTFGVSLSSVKRYMKAVQEGRSLSPGKALGESDRSSLRAQKGFWKPM